MALLGDLHLLFPENEAEALKRASYPAFEEFFPFAPHNPKPTLRNSTFIHLGPPPEAPRPWHSALGVRRARGAREPQRSISGTDVQICRGFVASAQYDGQADDYQSTMAKAPSPQRYATVDTTGSDPNRVTVGVPTARKRKRLDLCRLENIPLMSRSSPGLETRTPQSPRASEEHGKRETDLRAPRIEHVQKSQAPLLTKSNAPSAINVAGEKTPLVPGRVFRDEAGRKRLIPIMTSVDMQIPIHDSKPSPEHRSDLPISILTQSPEFEDTRLGKKSRRLASQMYLGLDSLPVDSLFYDKAKFGDMLDTRTRKLEHSIFARSAYGSTGQQLYVHSRIKHYLRSQPLSLSSDTENRLGRLPYPSRLGRKKMPLSVTTFARNTDNSVVAFRSKRLSWRKESLDSKQSARNDAEEPGLFDGRGTASEVLDLDDELKGLEKWKYLDEHQHVLPAYGDSGSEGEYDMDTWKEMEDEADRKLERPERKSSKLLLNVGKVQNTITVAMEAMIADWNIRKRPKLEAKAWRMWTKARRDKTLHYQIGVKDGKIKDLELRVKKLCARILDESWNTTKALTRQCKIMEVSIFDLEESKWAREILLNPLAPKKARITARPNKRAPKQDFSARDTSPLLEGEEIVGSTSDSSSTSSDELEDFIVSDEDDSTSLRLAAVCDSDSLSSTVEKVTHLMPVANNQQPAPLPQRPRPQSLKTASSYSKHLSHNIIDLTLDPENSEDDSKTTTEATISRISTPPIDSDSSSGIWRRGKKQSFKTPSTKRAKEEVVDLVSSPEMDYPFLSDLPADKQKLPKLPKSDVISDMMYDERASYPDNVVVKSRAGTKREDVVINNEAHQLYRRRLDPRFGNGRTLKPHQVNALQKIWRGVVETSDPGHGYILAHTMGLGKTATIIAVIYAIAQIGQSNDNFLKLGMPDSFHNAHVLILCPAHLVKNWIEELRRWLPIKDERRISTVQKVTSSDPIENRFEIVRNWISCAGILVMAFTMFKDLVVDPKNAPHEPAAYRVKPTARKEVRDGLLAKTALVIVDEAHSIKNPQSEISNAVKRIRTRRRIGLTGSPLSNNLAEYFALINWAAPGYLGSHDQFRDRYEKAIEKIFRENITGAEYRSAIVALKALQRDIEPRVDRQDSSTLDKELFGKEEFLVRIPLSVLQFDLYKNYTNHLERSSVQEAFRRWKHIRVLQLLCLHPSLLLDDLRACSNSWDTGRQNANFEEQLPDSAIEVDAPIPPDIYVEPETDPELGHQRDIMSKIHTSTEHLLEAGNRDWTSVLESYKMQVLLAIVDQCFQFKDKVLIFSQRKPIISYVAARLRKDKFDVVLIEGQVHPEKRQEISEAFNKSTEFQICVISTLAGGIGLNLHGANRVIILDEGYNPTHEEQAIGRAYRIGQRKKVYVYRLVCAGTVEEAFRDQGILKGNLAARVLDRKVADGENIRGNGRSPKVVGPKLADYEDLSYIIQKDRLLDQMVYFHGREFIASITSLHSYRPEDTKELTAAEEMAVEVIQREEKERREAQLSNRASTSKANGSRGQSRAPSEAPPARNTVSATTDARKPPVVAKSMPASSSGPSFPKSTAPSKPPPALITASATADAHKARVFINYTPPSSLGPSFPKPTAQSKPSPAPITASAMADTRKAPAVAKSMPASSSGSSIPKSTALSKPSSALITASATADARKAPVVALPAPSSGLSIPTTAPNSRATSLPSTPATSNHEDPLSNAPAASANGLSQSLMQSTRLVRFRMDAPDSEGEGFSKRQKLE